MLKGRAVTIVDYEQPEEPLDLDASEDEVSQGALSAHEAIDQLEHAKKPKKPFAEDDYERFAQYDQAYESWKADNAKMLAAREEQGITTERGLLSNRVLPEDSYKLDSIEESEKDYYYVRKSKISSGQAILNENGLSFR